MDNLSSQPDTQPQDYLRTLADRMKRAARHAPGKPVYPPQPLKNGAQLVLRYLPEKRFVLRIARHGLSPLNDYSANATRRLNAWRTECKTFCAKFGVAPDAAMADGAQELIYFVDVTWNETVPEAPALA